MLSQEIQALSGLLFLYREVLGVDLLWLDNLVRAKPRRRLPVVLSREDVALLRARMTGRGHLMTTLLYGSGLRLLECVRLRVMDVEIERNQIVVRRGKGDRDRVTLLPAAAKTGLEAQLRAVKQKHEVDLAKGAGWVLLSEALQRKYPTAGRELPGQWIFPGTRVRAYRAGNGPPLAASSARERSAEGRQDGGDRL